MFRITDLTIVLLTGMVIGVDVEIVIWNRNIGLGYQVNDFGLVWSRVSASDEYELNCVQAKSG